MKIELALFEIASGDLEAAMDLKIVQKEDVNYPALKGGASGVGH